MARKLTTISPPPGPGDYLAQSQIDLKRGERTAERFKLVCPCCDTDLTQHLRDQFGGQTLLMRKRQ